MPHKTIIRTDVAKNNTDESCWIVIDAKVYDLTDFLEAHPGGEAVLK
jgi:cytochrome b involved in lipid metabolism